MALRPKTGACSGAAALLLIVLSAGAHGADQAEAPPIDPTPAQVQAFQEAKQRLAEIEARIAAAQKAATEQDPRLAADQETLVRLLISKMEAGGYDVAAETAHINELALRLQSDQASEAARAEVAAEIRETRAEMEAARDAALNDPEVVELRRQVEQRLRQAMREQEPALDRLVEQLKETNEEMLRIAREAAGG